MCKVIRKLAKQAYLFISLNGEDDCCECSLWQMSNKSTKTHDFFFECKTVHNDFPPL